MNAQDDYDRMIQQSPDLYRVGYQASDGAIPAGIAEQALTLMLFSVLRDILSTYQPRRRHHDLPALPGAAGLADGARRAAARRS